MRPPDRPHPAVRVPGLMEDVARRFGRQSLAYSLAGVVGPGTGILLLPLYTRLLSPADYGLIALLETISLLLGTVFSFGMTAVVPFFYTDQRDPAVRRGSLATLVGAITVLNAGFLVLAWVAGPPTVRMLVPSVPFHPYVPILILTAFLEPYWTVCVAVLQIQERAFFFSLLSIGRVVLSIVSRILLVAVVPWGVYGFVVANLATAAVTAMVVALVLAREMTPRFVPKAVKEALWLGAPMVPNNLLTYGLRVLDRVILDRFVTRDQIGLYYLAQRIADVLRMIADVCLSSWRPIFFKEASSPTFAADVVPRTIRGLSVAFVSAAVALSLFAREFIAVLAPSTYAGASYFVPALAGAIAVKGIYIFPYLALWYRKKTVYMPVLTGITMVFTVTGSVWAAPRFGPMGVALVLLASYCLLLVLASLVSQRFYPLRYPWRKVVTAAVLGTVVVLAGMSVTPGVLSLGLRGLLFGVYLVSLVPLGCIEVGELRGALVFLKVRRAEAHPVSP